MITRLVIIAVTPAISIALAVYLSDRYDKEPLKLLLKTFLFGAFSTLPTIVVERFLVSFNIFPGILGVAYISFIVAGFTEEFFKREVVLRLNYNNPSFNEKLDGIVYSVFSALGFATLENIMYLLRFSTFNPYIGLYRGILSVPAHTIFAVTMGYYLSLAKYSDSEAMERIYLRKSLFMPAILHGIFDFILMSNIPIIAFLFIPYVIYIWRTNQIKLNQYIVESAKRHYKRDREE